jgi:hypothetical protein
MGVIVSRVGGAGRRQGFVAGLAVAAIGLAWWGIGPRALRAQEKEAKPDRTAALVEQKLQLSLNILKLVDKSRAMGAPVRAPTQEIALWSRHVLEARIYLSLAKSDFRTQDVEVYLSRAKGPANAERVAAFEEYLRRVKALEDLYRPLFERGNFSAYDFGMIEALRLQAEIWLSREKERA